MPDAARQDWPTPEIDLTASGVAEDCCDSCAFPWRQPNELDNCFKAKLEFYFSVHRYAMRCKANAIRRLHSQDLNGVRLLTLPHRRATRAAHPYRRA